MFQFIIRDFKAALIELTFGIIHPKNETNIIIANQQKLYNIALKEVLIIKKKFSQTLTFVPAVKLYVKRMIFFSLDSNVYCFKNSCYICFYYQHFGRKTFFFK